MTTSPVSDPTEDPSGSPVHVPVTGKPVKEVPVTTSPMSTPTAEPSHSQGAMDDTSMCNAKSVSESGVTIGKGHPPMGCSTFFYKKDGKDMFSSFCSCRQLGQLDVPPSIFSLDGTDVEYAPVTTIVSGLNTSLTVQAPYTDGDEGEDFGVDRLVIGPLEVAKIPILEEKAGSGTWTGDIKKIQLMSWNVCGPPISCDAILDSLSGAGRRRRLLKQQLQQQQQQQAVPVDGRRRRLAKQAARRQI